MDTTVDWSEREPEHYQRADELLMMEQSRDRVIMQLIAAGLPETDATALVEQVWGDARDKRREEGQRELNIGLLSMGGCVLFNVLAEGFLIGLGVPVRILLWGPFVYGAGSAYWGWKKLVS